MLIKTNGLGATYAFIYSKDDEAYKEIYRNTKEWLECEDGGLIDLSGNECELVKRLLNFLLQSIERLLLKYWHFFNGSEGLQKGCWRNRL